MLCSLDSTTSSVTCNESLVTCSLGAEILLHLRVIAVFTFRRQLNAEPIDVSADEVPPVRPTQRLRRIAFGIQRGLAFRPHYHLGLLRCDVLLLTRPAVVVHAPQGVSACQAPLPASHLPSSVQHRIRNS